MTIFDYPAGILPSDDILYPMVADPLVAELGRVFHELLKRGVNHNLAQLDELALYLAGAYLGVDTQTTHPAMQEEDTMKHEETWRRFAACNRPEHAGSRDLFVSSKAHDVKAAKAICRTCPGKPGCKRTALQEGTPHSVRGEMSRQEQRELMKSGTCTAVS